MIPMHHSHDLLNLFESVKKNPSVKYIFHLQISLGSEKQYTLQGILTVRLTVDFDSSINKG